jgi:hypothetical protein
MPAAAELGQERNCLQPDFGILDRRSSVAFDRKFDKERPAWPDTAFPCNLAVHVIYAWWVADAPANAAEFYSVAERNGTVVLCLNDPRLHWWSRGDLNP